MNWLSQNVGTFIWAVLAAGVLAAIPLFFAGFFGEAGKDAWQLLKQKLSPRGPDSIEVEPHYPSLGYAPGMCEWVRETALRDRESAGWTYYLHPEHQARVFRFPNRDRQIREYLMVKPRLG